MKPQETVKNDYSQGIYQANLQIVRKIAEYYGVELTGMPKLAPVAVTDRRTGLSCCALISMLVFF